MTLFFSSQISTNVAAPRVIMAARVQTVLMATRATAQLDLSESTAKQVSI